MVETSPASTTTATTANPTTAAPQAGIPSTILPATEENQTTCTQPTLKQRLDAAEHPWPWKASARLLLILLSLIGLSAISWALATVPDRGLSFHLGYGDAELLYWTLVTFGSTIIWCTICILLLVFRGRKHGGRPVMHPGVAVGFDLVLWMCYVPTGMFALWAMHRVEDYGLGGYIGYYAEDSSVYEKASNGTFIVDEYVGPRDCTHDGYFKDCAEKDAYINALFRSKGHRAAVERLAVVCQFVCLGIHFALFVRACVDTKRYRRGEVGKDEEKLAEEIGRDMIGTSGSDSRLSDNAGTVTCVPSVSERSTLID